MSVISDIDVCSVLVRTFAGMKIQIKCVIVLTSLCAYEEQVIDSRTDQSKQGGSCIAMVVITSCLPTCAAHK